MLRVIKCQSDCMTYVPKQKDSVNREGPYIIVSVIKDGANFNSGFMNTYVKKIK